MKNIYNKELDDFTRLTRHYQDWEVELAKPNKDYITTDYFCPRRDISYDDCLNKLGKLEDIEEELGIDLVKLIECIRNEKGIWKKDFDGSLINTRCMLACYFGRWQIYDKENIYDLKDYGKTWALTEEDLE